MAQATTMPTTMVDPRTVGAHHNPAMSVADAMNAAIHSSSRVRPRPVAPAYLPASLAPVQTQPNAPAAEQRPQQSSLLQAAMASLPPHIQAALAPPPVPPGVDPVCGPYYTKPIPPDVLAITVHKSDEFRADIMLTNPVVRLHVLDPNSGEYLKSLQPHGHNTLDTATQAQMVRYAGRPSTLTLANNTGQPTPALQGYLPPLQTAPYNLVRRAAPAASAVWGETLLVDEALERLVAEDALLVFEILQLPVSFHRYCKHPDQFPDGTHRVAWAFLRLSRPDLTVPLLPGAHSDPMQQYTHAGGVLGAQPMPGSGYPWAGHGHAGPGDGGGGKRALVQGDLKLQLYRYRPARGLFGGGSPGKAAVEQVAGLPVQAFEAWKALVATGGVGLMGPPVDKYPAALHITLEALPRPEPIVVKIDPATKLRAVLPAGYGSGFEEGSVPFVQFMLQTFGAGTGGLGGAGLLGDQGAMALEKSPWYRSRGEPCKLPNRPWKFLPTAGGGACCAAFSNDGARVAVAVGEGNRAEDFHILLYSTVTCAELARMPCAHRGWVHALAWSSDDKALISASSDCTAKVWEMALFQAATKTIQPRTLRHPCHVYSTAFHPKQAVHPVAVTGAANGAIYVWHRYSGQPLGSLLPTTCPPSPLLPSAAAARVSSSSGRPAVDESGSLSRTATGNTSSRQPLGELSAAVNVLTFDTLGTRVWAGDAHGVIQEFAVESSALTAAVARVLAGLPPGEFPDYLGPGPLDLPTSTTLLSSASPGAHMSMAGPRAAAAAPRYAPQPLPNPQPMFLNGQGPVPQCVPGPDMSVVTNAPLLPPAILWQWVPELHAGRSPPPPAPPMYPASPDALSQTVMHQQRVLSGGGMAPTAPGPMPGQFLVPAGASVEGVHHLAQDLHAHQTPGAAFWVPQSPQPQPPQPPSQQQLPAHLPAQQGYQAAGQAPTQQQLPPADGGQVVGQQQHPQQAAQSADTRQAQRQQPAQPPAAKQPAVAQYRGGSAAPSSQPVATAGPAGGGWTAGAAATSSGRPVAEASEPQPLPWLQQQRPQMYQPPQQPAPWQPAAQQPMHAPPGQHFQPATAAVGGYPQQAQPLWQPQPGPQPPLLPAQAVAQGGAPGAHTVWPGQDAAFGPGTQQQQQQQQFMPTQPGQPLLPPGLAQPPVPPQFLVPPQPPVPPQYLVPGQGWDAQQPPVPQPQPSQVHTVYSIGPVAPPGTSPAYTALPGQQAPPQSRMQASVTLQDGMGVMGPTSATGTQGPAGDRSAPTPPPPPAGPLLRPMRHCAAFNGEPLASLSLHPGGRKLLVLTRCSRLATVDTRAFNTARDLGRVKCRDALGKVTCSPDGAYVLAGGEDGVVRAYDGQAQVGTQVAHTPMPHLGLGAGSSGLLPVHCVVWNPQLHMVAVCGWGSWSPLLLAVWDKAHPGLQLGTEQVVENNSGLPKLGPALKKYELPDKLTPALVEGLLANVREDAHKRGVLTSPDKASTAPPAPGTDGPPITLAGRPNASGAWGRPGPHPAVDQLNILKPEEIPPEVLRLQRERAERDRLNKEEEERLAQRLQFPTPAAAHDLNATAKLTPTTPTKPGAAASTAAAAAPSSPPAPVQTYSPRDIHSKGGGDGVGAEALRKSGVKDARPPDPDPVLPAGVTTSLASYRPDLKGAAAAAGSSEGEARLLGTGTGGAGVGSAGSVVAGGLSPGRSRPQALHERPELAQVGFTAALPPQQQFPPPIMAGPGATVVVGPGATVYAQEGAKVVEVVDPLQGHVPNVAQKPYEMRLNQALPATEAAAVIPGQQHQPPTKPAASVPASSPSAAEPGKPAAPAQGAGANAAQSVQQSESKTVSDSPVKGVSKQEPDGMKGSSSTVVTSPAAPASPSTTNAPSTPVTKTDHPAASGAPVATSTCTHSTPAQPRADTDSTKSPTTATTPEAVRAQAPQGATARPTTPPSPGRDASSKDQAPPGSPAPVGPAGTTATDVSKGTPTSDVKAAGAVAAQGTGKKSTDDDF